MKLLAFAGSVATLLADEDWNIPTSLQKECSSKCPNLDLNQNRTEDSSPEVGCGVRCKVEQCTKGCEAWAQALDMSCQTVCVKWNARIATTEGIVLRFRLSRCTESIFSTIKSGDRSACCTRTGGGLFDGDLAEIGMEGHEYESTQQRNILSGTMEVRRIG